MTIKEVKKIITECKAKNPSIDFERGYNMAADFALKLIERYEVEQEGKAAAAVLDFPINRNEEV